MVDLVRAGRDPDDLAREFEPTAQSIRNWVVRAGVKQDGQEEKGSTPTVVIADRSFVALETDTIDGLDSNETASDCGQLMFFWRRPSFHDRTEFSGDVDSGRKPRIDAAAMQQSLHKKRLGPAAIVKRFGVGRASVYCPFGKAEA